MFLYEDNYQIGIKKQRINSPIYVLQSHHQKVQDQYEGSKCETELEKIIIIKFIKGISRRESNTRFFTLQCVYLL